MKSKIYILTWTIFVVLSFMVTASADYKIKQRTTINGQKIESTVLVKGSRKRTQNGGYMGMGADVETIEQCDLQRSVQVNDGKKLYFVEPFASASLNGDLPKTPVAQQKTVKGGTITMTYAISDTGERKQMFGLTARHIKTSMTSAASPDACDKETSRMETDGWYVDLPQFSCPFQTPRNPSTGGDGSGGCQDRMIMKQTGSGKIGFPLTLTTTFGDEGFSQTVETIEFSSDTLDASLFDVPKNYTLAKSSQDLYGKPDMNAMMRNAGGDDDDTPNKNTVQNNKAMSSSPVLTAKKSGVIRIGVYAPANNSGENVSETNLQAFLVGKLNGGKFEAVPIASESDAKTANCDYVLTSDFSKLAQSVSGKIGGMFGKITNTDSSTGRNYDATVNFKLVSFATGQTIAQSKASVKGEKDADRAAENVLSQEAATVLNAAK